MSHSFVVGTANGAELDEPRARALCLLRACEEGAPDAALWSPEDAAWASRLADETADASASPAAWLAERARHARERLLPRREPLARAYAHRAWGWRWLVVAALVGVGCGLVADIAGSAQHINLLHAPVWVVVAWNLAVYVGVALGLWRGRDAAAAGTNGGASSGPGSGPSSGALTRSGPLGRLMQRWLVGTPVAAQARAASPTAAPERRFVQLWAQVSAPLVPGRAAALMHVAAAALALGLVAGLYARALVLDYRVSWQSTLLEPTQVHTLLAVLLAPASALTGIVVPDEHAVAALRVRAAGSAAGGAAGSAALASVSGAASASALPWLHLLSATLGWAVVVPRLLLALLAAWASARRAARLPVVVDDAHSRRLLQTRRRDAVQAQRIGVKVLPHGFAPAPAATLALRRLLTASFGDAALLHIEPTTAYGDEDRARAQLPGAAWQIAWFELAATPEPQAQGRFVECLRAQAGARLVMLVDETGYRQRMGAASPRLGERRELWRRLAAEAEVGLALIDLEAAADEAAVLAAARAALDAAMDGALAAPPTAGPPDAARQARSGNG